MTHHTDLPMARWRKTTIEAVEAEHPSFENWPEWKILKAKMRPSDELIDFRTTRETWRALHGREGLSLSRNGKIIYSVLTKLN